MWTLLIALLDHTGNSNKYVTIRGRLAFKNEN